MIFRKKRPQWKRTVLLVRDAETIIDAENQLQLTSPGGRQISLCAKVIKQWGTPPIWLTDQDRAVERTAIRLQERVHSRSQVRNVSKLGRTAWQELNYHNANPLLDLLEPAPSMVAFVCSANQVADYLEAAGFLIAPARIPADRIYPVVVHSDGTITPSPWLYRPVCGEGRPV